LASLKIMLGGAKADAAVKAYARENDRAYQGFNRRFSIDARCGGIEIVFERYRPSTAANRIAEIKPIPTLLFSRLSFQAPANQLLKPNFLPSSFALTRKTTIICRKGVDHSDFVVRVWGDSVGNVTTEL
jgi:hypothetical protein